MLRWGTILGTIACAGGIFLVLVGSGGAQSSTPPDLVVRQTSSSWELSLGSGPPFHVTEREVRNARLVEVSNSTVLIALWDEIASDGQVFPFYALSPDGQEMTRVRQTTYELKLRHGEFDPTGPEPPVAASLTADASCNLYVVQFVTQPLEDYRKAIEALGATVYNFLANHSHIVKMTPAVKTQVEAVPIVRSVVPYHPAYRLEELLRSELAIAAELLPSRRYNIQVFEPGPNQKATVVARIQALGGTVDQADAGKFLLVATLTGEQLLQVITWDEVSFIDRWGPYEEDMNIARIISGANYVESMGSFRGEGVRGEVFDSGFNVVHFDLANRIILHTTVDSRNHGASTSGIVFGDGFGNSIARGLLPKGRAILADIDEVGLSGPSRYNHTGELVDPTLIYKAVFQTASVGTFPRTTKYTNVSADMDTIIFDFDILICQSQSNCGKGSTGCCFDGQCSCDAAGMCCAEPEISCNDAAAIKRLARPQAWAKNIVSVGGVKHFNTPNRDNDTWCQGAIPCSFLGCASIGPAADGRIKPELTHFDGCIDTITCCQQGVCCTIGAYTSSFGGTSGATPITCGYFGLLFQMWHEEVFAGFGGGVSVFDSRPHPTTARALMINTAYRYPFTQADFNRYNQGWGMVDVQKLYDLRDKMFIIDESYWLGNLLFGPTLEFKVVVAANELELLVTLVYADPPGNPAAQEARVNDLSLKVQSPSSAVYWGNNGLLQSNCSVADPDSTKRDTINTVENVFVCPAPGQSFVEEGEWTITVSADEINQDGHTESTVVDADFALVVTGMSDLVGACCLLPFGNCIETTKTACEQQGGDFQFDKTCATALCISSLGPGPSP